ncbi:MAG: histidinol dehydrogenase [Bacteroidota bacterium]
MSVATRLLPLVRLAPGTVHLHGRIEPATLPDPLPRILARTAAFSDDVTQAARALVADVQARGDAALRDATARFDDVVLDDLRVSTGALRAAYEGLDDALRAALHQATDNIRRFHERQRRTAWFTEDGDGVVLGQRYVPVDRAGLYAPGGTAAYPSSVLMNAIPAQVAGVDAVHLVSPPGADGLPHPLVRAAAHLLGLEHVYAVGGAQAIGALAYGTETIPAVDVIVGPGNAYVAAAKREVFGQVAIDSLAGPSEIVILADDTADARFVAADLLSQAEHDVRASAILVTTSAALAEAVQDAMEAMVPTLSRRAILEAALADYSAVVVCDTMDDAVALVNHLAPEHLEIVTRGPWATMGRIRHAGAIFLGPYSSEPVGDYLAGPNHVLPTGGTARYASALGVDTFLRRQSVIAYTRERLARSGPAIVRLADAEGLDAHARAIQERLDTFAEHPDGNADPT